MKKAKAVMKVEELIQISQEVLVTCLWCNVRLMKCGLEARATAYLGSAAIRSRFGWVEIFGRLPLLSNAIQVGIRENCRTSTAFPTGKELKKEIARFKNAEETRPKLFEGRTLPHASLTVQQYGRRIAEWFLELKEPFVTHTYDAGKLGIETDVASGEITKVTSGQPGWKTS